MQLEINPIEDAGRKSIRSLNNYSRGCLLPMPGGKAKAGKYYRAIKYSVKISHRSCRAPISIIRPF